jgi:hypothetical protein
MAGPLEGARTVEVAVLQPNVPNLREILQNSLALRRLFSTGFLLSS